MSDTDPRFPSATYEVFVKGESDSTWKQFHGLDGVDLTELAAIYDRLRWHRNATPALKAAEFQLVKVERTRGPYLPAHYDLAPNPSSLHVRRADGMDLCEYDDEDWPCTYARRAASPE